MLRKSLLIGWIAALSTAVAVWPVAALLASRGVRAQMIAPSAPDVVEVNQGLFELDAPDPGSPDFASKVTQIYGTPVGEPMDFVFVDDSRFLRPRELPSLTLLPVDKARGENPLQASTLYFFARWATLAAGLGFGVLGSIWIYLVRKRPAP